MAPAKPPTYQAKRGDVFLISVRFNPNDRPRWKYCVVMEDQAPGRTRALVAFTTSSLEFAHVPTTVTIPGGTFPDRRSSLSTAR